MKPKSDFWELYKHPKWQKKRLEVMQAAGHRCERCGDDEHELQIHHGFYARNRKPWEYPNETLFCLCKECHEIAGYLRVSLMEEVAKVKPDLYEEAIPKSVADALKPYTRNPGKFPAFNLEHMLFWCSKKIGARESEEDKTVAALAALIEASLSFARAVGPRNACRMVVDACERNDSPMPPFEKIIEVWEDHIKLHREELSK